MSQAPTALSELRSSAEVVVLGAGITGLTLGAALREAGVDVLVLEASHRIGGVIESEAVVTDAGQSFLVERGPNTLFIDQQVERLLEKLGLASDVLLAAPKARTRYLCTSASPKLTPAPASLLGAFRSPLISAQGKIRAAAEPFFASRNPADCSVLEFCVNHFGQEVAEELFATALTGIWAGDIASLSAAHCLPRLWEKAQQYRSILLGSIVEALRQKPANRRKIASFPRGLSQLCEQLAARLPKDSLQLNCRVTALEFSSDEVQLFGEQTRVVAQRVFLCVPAGPAAELLAPHTRPVADAIAAVPHSSLAVSQISFPLPHCTHTLDGVGYLAAPRLNRRALGALFFSSMFPQHAPPGHAVLSVFTGGAQGAPEENLDPDTRLELARLLGIGGDIQSLGGRCWQEAIPNYPVRHQQLCDLVERFEESEPRIRILGNWLDGISIADRISAAECAAKEFLASRQRFAQARS